jgi:hypothetical protein
MKMLKHKMQFLFMPCSYGLFPLKIAQKNRRRIRPMSLRSSSRLIFGTSSSLLCPREEDEFLYDSCMIYGNFYFPQGGHIGGEDGQTSTVCEQLQKRNDQGFEQCLTVPLLRNQGKVMEIHGQS